MPHATIGIVSSLSHPEVDRLSAVDRLVTFDECKRGRWSMASVASPPAGAALMMRENGIALVVGNAAEDLAVVGAMDAAPDPVVVVVVNRKPGSVLSKAVEIRGAHLILEEGGVTLVRVSDGAVTPLSLVPAPKPKSKPKPKPKSKPAPAPVAEDPAEG